MKNFPKIAVGLVLLFASGIACASMIKHDELANDPKLNNIQPANIGNGPAVSQIKLTIDSLQAGKLEEALKTVQAYLTDNPQSAAGQEVLGIVLGLKGDIPGARKSFEKALSLDASQWTAAIKIGDLDYAEHKIKAAETQYRTAALTHPNEPLLAQRLGLIEFANGHLTAATSLLEAGLVDLSDDSVSIRPTLGWIYNTRGEFQRTLSLFKPVPLDKVKDPSAYMIVAAALAGTGQVAEALSTLEKARVTAPKNPGVWQLTGRIARESGNYPFAIKALNEAMKLRPEWHTAEMELALVEIGSGKTEAGLRRAENVSKRSAKDPLMAFGLAQAYASAGNRTKAIELYRSLAKQPEMKRKANWELAHQLVLNQNLDEAEALLASEVRQMPREIETIKLLGSVQATQKKYQAAVTTFNSALAIDPTNPGVLRLQSITYAKIGEWKQAISTSEKLVNVMPSNVEALLLLAVQLEESGNTKNAEKQYREILARDPANLIAQNNLALLLLANGTTAEAVKLADALRKQAGNAPEIQDSVGWIYFKSGQKSEAMELLQQATAKGNSPNALYHLGVILADHGNRQQAAVALNKALTIDPAFKYARETKTLLASLK